MNHKSFNKKREQAGGRQPHGGEHDPPETVQDLRVFPDLVEHLQLLRGLQGGASAELRGPSESVPVLRPAVA